MKATDIRDTLFEIGKQLDGISTALTKEIDWDGIDPVYLDSKLTGHVLNTAKHVQGQLKHLKKKK